VTSPAEQISRSAALSEDDAARVRELAARVEAGDGAPALDEQADLNLSYAAPGVEHLLARAGDALTGYAQLQHPDNAADPLTAEIVAGLGDRRGAVVATLFDQVEDAAGARTQLLVWARSDAGPVRAEAERRGYLAARTLLTMARPLAGPEIPRAALPDGVRIRAFVAGRDDAAWLGVNARAFAWHPEQGRWTQADLDERIAQPWFDPAGFLLAVAADGDLLGFHWTKRHSPELGEVYVIAMDPSAQGHGLGKTLLMAGLEYLRGAGAATVILYTEQENESAVRLYEKTGFTVDRRQTQYRRRDSRP
jgi:mycothiol synthase